MAKIAAKTADFTLNSVSMEELIDKFSLKVTQELPVTTCLADAGPRRVPANYDWQEDIGGPADFASGSSDATLFGLVGSAGVAAGYDPTGATAAANDPNYDGTVLLGSYQIDSNLGSRTEFSASLMGGSALSRAVA